VTRIVESVKKLRFASAYFRGEILFSLGALPGYKLAVNQVRDLKTGSIERYSMLPMVSQAEIVARGMPDQKRGFRAQPEEGCCTHDQILPFLRNKMLVTQKP